MSGRFRFVFLCTSIYCHLAMGVTLSEAIREKAKHVYVVTCKKRRRLYEKIKKHKKIFAACVAYCAFECAGYAHDWDTPLRRLLTPKQLLDDAYERIANLTNSQQAEFQQQQVEDTHQAELHALRQQLEHAQQEAQQQQDVYGQLRERCEELEAQLQAMNEQQAIKEKKRREIVDAFNADPSHPFNI